MAKAARSRGGRERDRSQPESSASDPDDDAGANSSGDADDAGTDRGIDSILADLEQVVTELESGDLPLEKALERFEQGVRLARRGGKMLDRVEERVEMLLADRDDTVPFRETEGEDS